MSTSHQSSCTRIVSNGWLNWLGTTSREVEVTSKIYIKVVQELYKSQLYSIAQIYMNDVISKSCLCYIHYGP